MINPLVALLCFSLVGTGCLFWVDSAWVYISGGASGAETQADLKLFDLPLAGGYLIRGNGDQDDNKEEAFLFQSPAGIMAAMPPIMRAATNFRERRTAIAYKDFGHLKVMPAADAANSNENQTFLSDYERLLVCCGRPFVFYIRNSNGLHIFSINGCHYKTVAIILFSKCP